MSPMSGIFGRHVQYSAQFYCVNVETGLRSHWLILVQLKRSYILKYSRHGCTGSSLDDH